MECFAIEKEVQQRKWKWKMIEFIKQLDIPFWIINIYFVLNLVLLYIGLRLVITSGKRIIHRIKGK